MWHMGLRLPWLWRLGPSNSSERAHVLEMIKSKKHAKNTLFCGDAGFVGYPLWSAIIENKGHFLVRVGANVSLLYDTPDYTLGKKGIVLCWPKNQQSNALPLRLRLVKVRIGKLKVYLLTDVLDEKKLSPQLMAKFYKMRWGIEVEFRGLKQTLDYSKLRCRTEPRVLAELNWAIMAMAVAQLFALKEQSEKKRRKKNEKPFDPNKRSLANTMRAIRQCIRKPDSISEEGEDLATLLRYAVHDDYERKRSKTARYRPPNPDKKKLGDPQLRTMTAKEKQTLRNMEAKLAA
jgi:transposase